MRMSCNGCRVLRKGCSEDCSIRPCLQWIKNPESQANATVFLAKFYGRAGLMNLINAGPQHLRPGIFRSLLYEACGRIVNPIYGSVGLLWSGKWDLCQNAVEAVLKGAPIIQIASEVAETNNGPPLKAYDIRHVNKDHKSSGDHLQVVRNRCRFKKSGSKSKVVRTRLSSGSGDESGHGSSLSHQSEAAVTNQERESSRDSLVSVETSETEPESPSEKAERADDDGLVELELSLGFKPFPRKSKPMKRSLANDGGVCKMELGLN